MAPSAPPYDAVTFDTVILGGGAAGCAAAIALKNRSPQLRILLLEREQKPFPQHPRIGETLPPHTSVLFEQLGLLQNFKAHAEFFSHGTCAAWGGESMHDYLFLYSPYGHGWHLDRTAFDDWLLEQTQARAVEVRRGQTLDATAHIDGVWSLDVAGRVINSRTVIDASGRRAVFGRRQGAIRRRLDRLLSVYRFYQLPSNPSCCDSRTLVESCTIGWWYWALLPHGRCVVALMSDSDIVCEQHVLCEPGWQTALNATRHITARLDQAKPLGALQVRAAHSAFLEPVCGAAWFAAGDAAGTFDPLSSLGIFKALRQGMLASYAVTDILLGKKNATAKYQQLIRAEYQQYLTTRRDYYRRERRFACESFWQRRAH